jgi:Protein of unknown function (DUF2442)
MSTLRKKYRGQISNKKATDPFDKLIFEKGLHIRHLLLDKGIDLLALVLSNGAIIKSQISEFPRLRRATIKQLKNWKLVGGGIAVEWPDLDEDLSLKGFITSSYMSKALQTLQGKSEHIFI